MTLWMTRISKHGSIFYTCTGMQLYTQENWWKYLRLFPHNLNNYLFPCSFKSIQTIRAQLAPRNLHCHSYSCHNCSNFLIFPSLLVGNYFTEHVCPLGTIAGTFILSFIIKTTYFSNPNGWQKWQTLRNNLKYSSRLLVPMTIRGHIYLIVQSF